MSKIDYNDRRFRVADNSAGGEVGGGTLFHYRQSDDVVWATYEGGGIRFGTLVATVDPEGCLDMRYAHVNAAGTLFAISSAVAADEYGDVPLMSS